MTLSFDDRERKAGAEPKTEVVNKERMIYRLLQKYYSQFLVTRCFEFDLSIEITKSKKNLFSNSLTINALVYVYLKSNEINFTTMSTEAIQFFSSMKHADIKTCNCTWIIFSESAGIYLYEAFATAQNNRVKNFKNTFITINTLDGDVCFGPGHIKNRMYTERLRLLLQELSEQTVLQTETKMREIIYEIAWYID